MKNKFTHIGELFKSDIASLKKGYGFNISDTLPLYDIGRTTFYEILKHPNPSLEHIALFQLMLGKDYSAYIPPDAQDKFLHLIKLIKEKVAYRQHNTEAPKKILIANEPPSTYGKESTLEKLQDQIASLQKEKQSMTDVLKSKEEQLELSREYIENLKEQLRRQNG